MRVVAWVPSSATSSERLGDMGGLPWPPNPDAAPLLGEEEAPHRLPVLWSLGTALSHSTTLIPCSPCLRLCVSKAMRSGFG